MYTIIHCGVNDRGACAVAVSLRLRFYLCLVVRVDLEFDRSLCRKCDFMFFFCCLLFLIQYSCSYTSRSNPIVFNFCE